MFWESFQRILLGNSSSQRLGTGLYSPVSFSWVETNKEQFLTVAEMRDDAMVHSWGWKWAEHYATTASHDPLSKGSMLRSSICQQTNINKSIRLCAKKSTLVFNTFWDLYPLHPWFQSPPGWHHILRGNLLPLASTCIFGRGENLGGKRHDFTRSKRGKILVGPT